MSFLKSAALSLSLFSTTVLGCDANTQVGQQDQAITDVNHTAVERQSIGNCWLYSQATWVESMTLTATGEEMDVSQSYWTYWHWFDQVTGFSAPDEIQTGGFQFTAHQIVRDRGVMLEEDFVPEDVLAEMSGRQADALAAINRALENGDFNNVDSTKVREIFDDAWGLSDEVRAQLDSAFGDDGERTLRQGASLTGTKIMDPSQMMVQYTENQSGATSVRDASLVEAISDWNEVRYPFDRTNRRRFQQRVQRALHDGQPVVLTWNVDFNALENGDNEFAGSFNMQTLEEAGEPGRQGGHMTVLEDYAIMTAEFGLLEAGVTLDKNDPEDAAKLAAALRDDSEMVFLRTKNSWGGDRPDRKFAPGFPGYHDLYMDYMNGPIRFCPSVEDKTSDDCTGETAALRTVMLPPGY